MDVLIPLALLAVGLIIGFFVARYVYTQPNSKQAIEAAEKNLKEMLAQQAEHHLHQTRQSLSAIESQCNSLRYQLDEYESLLSQTTEGDAPKVHFFGEQATSYLRNNLKGKENNRITRVAETQPRDFANSGSGLFVGKSEQPAADKKSS
ncbi:ZapG family protein [Alteromonas sp. CYL-A6]|uniref:ZapG family protein n=1 Tax=Alteromonas nitratireducens TaxID=3390813 RepID=UPI0034C2FCD1